MNYQPNLHTFPHLSLPYGVMPSFDNFEACYREDLGELDYEIEGDTILDKTKKYCPDTLYKLIAHLRECWNLASNGNNGDTNFWREEMLREYGSKADPLVCGRSAKNLLDSIGIVWET